MISKGYIALVAVLFVGLAVALLDRWRELERVYMDPIEVAPPQFWSLPRAPVYNPLLPPDSLAPLPNSGSDSAGRDGSGWAYEGLVQPQQQGDDGLGLYEVTAVEYVEVVVAEGDSLWELERRFDVRFELIYELNRFELERNFSRRCGEPCGLSPANGHCSSPEATLQKGMKLKIPIAAWLQPLRSYKM